MAENGDVVPRWTLHWRRAAVATMIMLLVAVGAVIIAGGMSAR